MELISIKKEIEKLERKKAQEYLSNKAMDLIVHQITSNSNKSWRMPTFEETLEGRMTKRCYCE